jgi:NAD(P)-dependent dehydrogenase (short-subunit alcohol dehydrogenase family)
MSIIDNLFSVKGKVALVTGGTRGLGLMIARGYVEAGARVYITSRDSQACHQAELELAQYGECTAIPGDMSNKDHMLRLCEEIKSKEEKLHILVNNAGAGWGASYEDYPSKAWDKLFSLNVRTVFELTREVTPLLENAATEHDPARVINIGSLGGIQNLQTQAYAYDASKAAVHRLSCQLAVDLAPRGITVNAVAPGAFPTKMTDFEINGEHAMDMMAKITPAKRVGTPEDIAGLCIYLASRAGAFMTGAVLPLDGGYLQKRV